MKVNKWETARQLFHFSGLVVILIAYFLGEDLTGELSILFAVGLFFFSYYVKIKNEIRKNFPVRIKKLEELEDNFHNFIEALARERSEHHYMGAVLFFISTGVSLLAFSQKIAFIAITVLAVGDSFSTLVGVNFGRHKTKINPPKSYEGTIGGLVASFLACLIFTNPLTALIASSVGMTVELLPIKINDNILIPIIVGFFLWGLSVAGLVI